MNDETSKQEANVLSLSEEIDIYIEDTAALYTGPMTLPFEDPWRPRLCPTCGRPIE